MQLLWTHSWWDIGFLFCFCKLIYNSTLEGPFLHFFKVGNMVAAKSSVKLNSPLFNDRYNFLKILVFHSRNTSMTKMVAGEELGQRQICLPACQENNFHPTTELTETYPSVAINTIDESTLFFNSHDFCVTLVKLIDYCEDRFIRIALERANYHGSPYGSIVCSKLNQVSNIVKMPANIILHNT